MIVAQFYRSSLFLLIWCIHVTVWSKINAWIKNKIGQNMAKIVFWLSKAEKEIHLANGVTRGLSLCTIFIGLSTGLLIFVLLGLISIQYFFWISGLRLGDHPSPRLSDTVPWIFSIKWWWYETRDKNLTKVVVVWFAKESQRIRQKQQRQVIFERLITFSSFLPNKLTQFEN